MNKLTLVLLPGMDGTGDMFAPFVSAAGSRWDLQRVRYPNDPALGYAELEALVRSQLPRNAPYVVLAESFSGPIAASLSGTPPPGLVGIVLCCTFVCNPRPGLAALNGLLRYAPLKSAPSSATAAILMGMYSTPTLRLALSEVLAQVSTVTLRARLRAVLQVNVKASLASTKLPVLYLKARHDYLLPASAAKAVFACQPATAIVSIDGPHLLLQANPVPAVAAIQLFLDRLPSNGRSLSTGGPLG